jgi:hypothetical protein
MGWNKSMEKQKLAVSLILLSIVTPSVVACTFPFGNYGFLVYETRTQAWHINLGNVAVGALKTFNVTVECEEKSGEFLVTYFLEIDGPKGLCNDYLKLWWLDTDGAAFTIGKGGQQTFSGKGTITWNSQPSDFKAGHKNNVTLTFTFLTTAAIGKYSAKMWVAFTQKPIEAKVTISPAVLNVKSKGEWVTAYISLPEPYKEEDIDISSVKLWYKNSFVQAEWGKATKQFLMVKFSADEVIKMLKSETGKVQLTATGLVNGIEFSGTDTITVIKPGR